jgi:hypothetical protein
MGKNLPDDNALLFAIRDAARIMDPVLNIFDARPKLNANANAVKGKGFESMTHLGGSTKVFLPVLCHPYRAPFCALDNACRPSQHA